MEPSDSATNRHVSAGKLSFKRKLVWGVGGFGENIANAAILSLVYPIFNVALGMSTIAIGMAMAISRILDAVIDPVIGNLTDNTRSRWGRRRPWMFAGSILMALCFAAIWFLPGLSPELPKQVSVHLSAAVADQKNGATRSLLLRDNRSWYITSHRDLTLTPELQSAGFDLMLKQPIDAPLTFTVVRSETAANAPQITISPQQLTFTPDNAALPQHITITASTTITADATVTLRILPEDDLLTSTLLNSLGIGSWSETTIFIAFALLCLCFYFSFTVFVIPFSGLGIELTDDYAERTRLQIYRLVASFCASLMVGYLYLWSQKTGAWFGGDEVTGAQYVGLGIALLVLISTMIPALFCRERFAASEARKTAHLPLFKAVSLTAGNRSFRKLMGSVFAVFMGLFFSLPFMTYIGIYYCCQGDKLLAAQIGGVLTIIQTVGQFLAMPLISWASQRFEKRSILFTGLAISITGYASSWWLFTPAHPWLQIIPVVVAAWGLCACWAVNGSFAADICDEDELNTGHRREGLYSAVFALVYKSAIGIVALGSGVLLAWAGVSGQENMLSEDTLMRVRIAYLAIPVLFLSLAICSMWRYPLTRARVSEIQSQLRHERA